MGDVFVQIYKSTPRMLHIPICQMQSAWQTFIKISKARGSIGLFRGWTLMSVIINYWIHFLYIASNSWKLFLAFLLRAVLQSDRIVSCTLHDRKMNQEIAQQRKLLETQKAEEKQNESDAKNDKKGLFSKKNKKR